MTDDRCRACRHCRARFTPKPTGRPQLYCSAACRKAAARRRKHVPAHWRTGNDEWGTPQEFFDRLNAEFGFTVDVCATPDKAKCKQFFTKRDDGLAQVWEGVCWCNPPYSEVRRWVAKAFDTARAGGTVVCLVPANTDVDWWHEFAPPVDETRFVRHRLKFTGNGATSSAPFKSAVLVFRPALRTGSERDETRDERTDDALAAVAACPGCDDQGLIWRDGKPAARCTHQRKVTDLTVADILGHHEGNEAVTDAADFLEQLLHALNRNRHDIAQLARRLDRYETRDLVASLHLDHVHIDDDPPSVHTQPSSVDNPCLPCCQPSSHLEGSSEPTSRHEGTDADALPPDGTPSPKH